MKKLLLTLSFLATLIFVSGCFTEETTITFTQLPQPIYYVIGSEGYIPESTVKGQIAVTITTGADSKVYYLNDPALEVTGLDFSSVGSKTLTVKYQSASITYTYQVVNSGEVVVTVDTSWYTTNPNAATFSLQDAADLRGLAKLVNDGTTTFKGKTVVLLNDIDLGNVIWTPIGEGDRSTNDGKFFEGTFDGNNHKISNLTNAGYVYESTKTYLNSAGIILRGYCYGLFARVKDAVIKNVIIESVNIFADTVVENSGALYGGDSVGAIVGYASGTELEVINCHVLSGTIIAIDAVAGIVGRDYRAFSGSKTGVFTNCTNAANITATLEESKTGKAGGILGFTQVSGYGGNNNGIGIRLTDCTNTGTVSAYFMAGGLVGGCYTYEIPGSSNKGEVIILGSFSDTHRGDLIGRVG